MISAQPNKPQQEKLIAKLMDLPNNAVRNVVTRVVERRLMSA
jgi:exportin-1